MDWFNTNAPLLGLLSTLGLLGVTFWYAKTTSDMAGESARAATAAENAAGAARDAATVAQSQISPNFAGRLTSVWSGDTDDKRTACIHLKSIGDSVVVKQVRSRRSFRKGEHHGLSTAELINETFHPHSEEHELPRRLHHDETVLLTHPALNDGGNQFERFIVEIDYTFTESGETGGTRRLSFDAGNKAW